MSQFLINDNEIETTQQKAIKEEVQQGIRVLIEKFWITREGNEELFYLIKDNEPDIKNFFRETLRYHLISTHDLIKLEKVPVTTYPWMGNKEIKTQKIFQHKRDFVFLFCLLAFLEGKGKEDQFSLQDICEALQGYYPQTDEQEPTIIIWKEGAGYKNRLSLIRVLKYASHMELIRIIDQDVEDFSGDANHDVLFERTLYLSHFIRSIKESESIHNFNDFTNSLKRENEEHVDAKHRYYRRLFFEPIVYNHELSAEELAYVKNQYHHIENNVNRYTDYEYERYQNNTMLVKKEEVTGEVLHPSSSMLSTLVLQLATYVLEHPQKFTFNATSQIEVSINDLEQILSKLKETNGKKWTKTFRTAETRSLRKQLTDYLLDWKFATELPNGSFSLREGLFRVTGDYFDETTKKVEK